uniref:Carboxypeptidase regulatory-like domain-containing protein n=1 Tax=Solibacter usitatus (strain Ellin6076) TaxID=234267 RepID=Q023S5_SOLUE
MRLLCALALISAALRAQTIEGTATDALTGLPVPGAAIQLYKTGGMPAREAVTDSRGHFRIEGLTEGGYFALIRKEGYSNDDANKTAGQHFHLSKDETVRLEASMAPLGKVSGRVLGTNEFPISGARVLLRGVDKWNSSSATTDRSGAFILKDVEPGMYVLIAQTSTEPPDEHLAYVTTYYPSVYFREGGATIIVGAGAELVGEDIRLRTAPAWRLRGRLVAPSGDPASGAATVNATSDTESSLEPEIVAARALSDGRFEFPRLHRGRWSVTAVAPPAGAAFRQVEVVDRDIDEWEIRLAEPFTLNVKIVRDPPPANPQSKTQMRVFLIGGGNRDMREGSIDAKGEFPVTRVMEGQYRIVPLLGDTSSMLSYYLASIRVMEREVLGETVELTAGSRLVTILYKADGGGVRGTVQDCGSAHVILVPQERTLRSLSDLVRQATCDAVGHFEIANMRPGEYYAYAFGQQTPIKDVAELPVNQAVPVTVRSGEFSGAALRVTPIR